MTQPAPASPVYWRFNPEVFRLIGIKCNDCGHISYPRTKICHECGSLNLKEYKLAKKGTVHTYCVNWAPPPNFARGRESEFQGGNGPQEVNY